MSLIETGRFETLNGSKYLQQLCKHFAHKVAVEFGPDSGAVDLPPGPARLTATGDALSVEITAEDEIGLEHARNIIDDHLKRFAFREECEGMDWTPK